MSQKKIISLIATICVMTFGAYRATHTQVTPRSRTYKPNSVASTKQTSQKNTLTDDEIRASTGVSVYIPVERVIDGDTIIVTISGTSERVRLLGINTPETVDPRRAVQCFGTQASDKAKELLTGSEVSLELDPSQGLYDKYGRLLAYVRTKDLFFNEYMVQAGYAYEYTYNTPYKYQSDFKRDQATAQAEEKGLWARGVCGK